MNLCRPALDIKILDGKLDIWKEEGDKEGKLGVRVASGFASFSSLSEQELVSRLPFWHAIRERQLDLSSPWINAQSNRDSNTRARVY